MALASAAGGPAQLGGEYDAVFDGHHQYFPVGVCCNCFVNAVWEGDRPVIYWIHNVPLLKKQDNVAFEPFLRQGLVEVAVAHPLDELLDRGGGGLCKV